MRNRQRSIIETIIRRSIPVLVLAVCLCFRFPHFRWQALAAFVGVAVSFFCFCPKRRIVRSRKATLTVFLPLLLFVCVYALLSYGITHTRYCAHDLDRNAFRGKKILVMVPHQDDEINLFGGLYEIFEEDADVYVVFSTNGDRRADAETRAREATAALKQMGIDRDHIIFLGYGDSLMTNEGIHIYNLPGDEVLTSSAGYTETYAADGYEPYRHSSSTRDSIKGDIRALLMDLKPDVIFCLDYDYHHDHRALSLFFEEAMGDILGEEQNDYTPVVFKGFAYSTAYLGEPDFYADNIRSTVPYWPDCPAPGACYTDENGEKIIYMAENNIYRWDERIRFPVAENNLSRTLHSSNLAEAMHAHASQDILYDAFDSIPGIINGDKVFWLRDTSGLLYRAEVSVSSGDGSMLTDFKLTDSPDIYDKTLKPFANLWSPDREDGQKTAAFTFGGETALDSIRLYDNPSLTDNIIRARILFSDGSEIICGPLAINGSATTVRFEERKVTSFTVQILASEGERAGLTEVEAYLRYDPSAWIPDIVKLKDENGDFVYDYQLEDGEAVFSVYDARAPYEEDRQKGYSLAALSGTCEIRDNGDRTFTVSCPKGGSAELALCTEGEDTPADLVTVRNPYAPERWWNSMLIEAEKRFGIYTPAEQYRYFRTILDDYWKKLPFVRGN